MADAPRSNTGPLGVPPGGPWFVWATGTIQRQSNPVLAEALVAAGWVGFATNEEAKAFAANSTPAGAAHTAVDKATGAATTIDDFLSRLTSPNLWLRVAEIALGLVLIAVGIAKLTDAIPLATKAAKTAGKIGAIAAL